MTNKEYHLHEAVSKSDLDLINKSPAHYIEAKMCPKEQTPSMLLGSVVHKLILEPETFCHEYAVCPEIDRRTKAGKEQWKEFTDGLTDDITVIDKATYELALTVAEAVKNHPVASRLLTGGQAEQSYFWNHKSGTECKCRPDYLRTDIKTVVDVKTTQDASPEEFTKTAYKFRYHVQAAWYTDGLKQCGIDINNFMFIVVETKAPYNVMVYAADDNMMTLGRSEAEKNLETYISCKKCNNWHGYEESPKINSLSLPEWVLRKEF